VSICWHIETTPEGSLERMIQGGHWGGDDLDPNDYLNCSFTKPNGNTVSKILRKDYVEEFKTNNECIDFESSELNLGG
jgi:hypothetical protein